MKLEANLMEVEELCAKIGRQAVKIVDCRFNLMQPSQGREDYLSGHIPGAVYADLNKDLSSPPAVQTGRHPLPDPQRFREFLGKCGIDNNAEVVVYDQNSGAFALRLWWLLAWQGHARVHLLNGGLDQWVRCGQGLSRGDEQANEIQFTGDTDNSLTVSAAQIIEGIRAGNMPRLVDARSQDRFLGKSEPIDAVAGHIPGAVNFPLQNSLDDHGRWQQPGDVRALWGALPGGLPESPYVVMCGSGVTACHLAFSARYAGLSAPLLYAGSWSEWIQDPARPVATGS